MSAESERDRLPFEPRQKRNKPQKQKQAPPPLQQQPAKASKANASLNAIPDVVSKRMVRRMALFCGIPTALGLFTFIASYWIVLHDWFELPTIAVVMVSMGFFGLGVLGLTYGILSASWDESRIGSWFGWEEFTTNVGRMTAAWRSAKES
ncbi:MAG: PAM68 family protein [Cyanobacteriota bacterium]